MSEVPFSGHVPRACIGWLGAETMSQKLHPDLPGIQSLEPSPAAPRVCISRKLESSWGGTVPSEVGCGHLCRHRSCQARCVPLYSILSWQKSLVLQSSSCEWALFRRAVCVLDLGIASFFGAGSSEGIAKESPLFFSLFRFRRDPVCVSIS